MTARLAVSDWRRRAHRVEDGLVAHGYRWPVCVKSCAGRWFSGVPYHHVMGSVYGAARLSHSVQEEHRTEQAV